MPTSVTTAEELLSLREPGLRHELVRGELRRMSPAGYWHGEIASKIDRLVGNHVEARRLGKTFGAETGFLITRNPDTVRAPDVAFVDRDRLPRQSGPGYFPGPPDLAIEVISPGDSPTEVHEKAICWLAHGTRLVWVVDPQARRVTVYRSTDDVCVLGVEATLMGGEVLPGFATPVIELFTG